MTTTKKTDGLRGEISARVYYADTDFSGVVYHARYLEFFERGRTELLREVGISHQELYRSAEAHEILVFAVRHMEIEFLKPAHIDDQLHIVTQIDSARGARILLKQELFRLNRHNQELLCRAAVDVVLMNKNGRPTRIPKAWLDLFF